MRHLADRMKIDIGLVSQALNNSNATGRYYNMAMYRKALFVLNGGAMAAGKTTKIELLQAKDADGTDAKAIANADATITANTAVTEATIDLSLVANTDVVTINGIDFTKAAATDASAREFADAAGLVTCVNHETYGVEGVTASVNGNIVTLKATDPGAVAITLDKTENAGTITLATTKAIAYVEVDASYLDIDNGFTHVAAKVTTTADTVVSVVMLRGDGRFSPEQAVGAYSVQ
ncbi:MAG: hypothetical protein H0Z28_13425 [Archaeoglobus sp.]|nr:hypothetical protein [Archaeoglobus sp.]